jgi:hypothetical protein
MIPNFKKPFSAFTDGDNNPASFIIAQHYEARDLAIKRLVSMYEDDYDIADREVFNSVLETYGLLNDGFESEEEYIVKEVGRRLRACGYC